MNQAKSQRSKLKINSPDPSVSKSVPLSLNIVGFSEGPEDSFGGKSLVRVCVL